MAKEKLMDRARDELFSHINRCGVLKADPEDQETWMQETMDYIGERYPDLSDADLDQLHQVGIRFCKPAIPHGAKDEDAADAEAEAPPAAAEVDDAADAEVEAPVPAEEEVEVEAEEDANAA